MKEKKNKIIIRKSGEDYSLYYKREDPYEEPKIIINSMGFYDIIKGLIDYLPRNVYEKVAKKVYFNEDNYNKIPEKEKEIFKGLINILEKSAKEKNLEYKIKEIKKILIKKDDKEKFLIMERSRNEEESFNSLYKIAKE